MVTNYDGWDAESLALCAWREARGEGEDGMRAVMHVICNRVDTEGFAKTIHDVIYGKNQFTSMSIPSDPEFNLKPAVDDPQYKFCMDNCRNIMAGSDRDITFGAHYYENPTTASGGWFLHHIVADPINHPFTVQIGHQKFYK